MFEIISIVSQSVNLPHRESECKTTTHVHTSIWNYISHIGDSAYLLNSYPKDSIVITLEKIRDPNMICSVGDSVTKSKVAMDPKNDTMKLLPILADDFFQFNVQQFWLQRSQLEKFSSRHHLIVCENSDLSVSYVLEAATIRVLGTYSAFSASIRVTIFFSNFFIRRSAASPLCACSL